MMYVCVVVECEYWYLWVNMRIYYVWFIGSY